MFYMPRLVGQDRTSSKRSKKYLEGEKRECVKPPDLNGGVTVKHREKSCLKEMWSNHH